jgi:iron complex outermembrane recepter protein
VPLVQNRPGVVDLTVDAGYRYSDYSTAGATNTWKLEAQYAPLPDLRLRGSYDRVVRAPNLIELYTPQSYAQSSTLDSDPCAPTNGGATHASASLSACEHTGVTAAEYGNGFGPAVGGTNTILQCAADACGQLIGGNPALAPEAAGTWSIGLSLTPSALPNLTASLDYYRIALKKEIGTVTDTIILNECLATGNPFYCNLIVRGPQGQLSGVGTTGGGYIVQTLINTGTAVVAGIDLQSSYRQPLPGRWGAVTATFTGSWLQHNSAAAYPGAPSIDCAGLFGDSCLGGSVNPTWRHNLRLSWESLWKLVVSAQWRFIGRSSFDNNSPQFVPPYPEEGFFDPVVTHIPNYSYLDLAAIWSVTGNVTLRVGVNNVLDKDPPFLPAADVSSAAGSFNTFPTYDLLGREIFAALRVTF